MRTLKKLNANGRGLVDDAFLSSDSATVMVGEGHIEELERRVDLEDFHDVVEDSMKKFTAFDPKVDRHVAPRLHRALPLNPREAGDVGIWHYLAVIESPQFVRHRWQPEKGKITKNRFLGGLVRNSFARLWWGAHLTVKDGSDYSATENLFSKSQDLYEAVFGRAFCYYPDAVRAFLNVIGSESQKVFRESAKNLTHVLTTAVLEDLDQTQIEDLLREILAYSK